MSCSISVDTVCETHKIENTQTQASRFANVSKLVCRDKMYYDRLKR